MDLPVLKREIGFGLEMIEIAPSVGFWNGVQGVFPGSPIFFALAKRFPG